MSSPRITSRRAVQALRPLLDDDIAGVAAEEHAAVEAAAVDALIEQAEREWAAAERTESARLSRMFTDQLHARRARRRANRRVLRMLPDLLRPLDPPVDHDSGIGCAACRREREVSA